MRSTILCRIASALLAMAAAAGSAFAETYDVWPRAGEAGLREALEYAGLDAEPGEVVVHAGEYAIAGTLSIWPGTTLTLEDRAVLKAQRGFDGAMLEGRHWDSEEASPVAGTVGRTTCRQDEKCSHGGYSQCHDVVVRGGTWDRNSGTSDNSAILAFRHASGIVVRDLTAKNCSNHFFNFSGSEDVLVENVSFQNAVGYLGSDPDFWMKYKRGDTTRYQTIEAIHLDFMDEVGEAGSYPADGTPCRDVLVSKCRFDSVFAGVGTHHYASKAPATGVRIAGCGFRNLDSYAVYCFGFEGMEVEDCEVSGGRGLLDCKGASCFARGNVVDGAKLYCVFATEDADVELRGNTFRRAEGIAVCVRDGASVNAAGNVFDTTGGHSITLIGCDRSVLSGNTFRNAAKTAVLVTDKSVVEVAGNTIASAGTQGITAQKSAKLTARANTVSGAKGIGILVDSAAAGSSVVGNAVSDSGSHGIRIFKTKDCTVDSNVVTGGKADGIVIDQCGSGTVSRNSVKKTAKHAVRLAGTKAVPTTVVVQGNVLSTGKPKKSFDIRVGDYCRKCKIVANDLVHKRYSVSKKGTKKITYKPVPTTISSATRSANRKSAKVVWKKYARTTGYELQYSEKASFKKAKTLAFPAPKKVKATVKKLSKKKKYYFRVRTYQDLNHVRYYSDWSPVVIAVP